MPVVPIRNRTVQPQAPQVGTPNVGSGVPGAFGEQVAEAQINLGAAGVKLGAEVLQHIERERLYREQEQADDLSVKFSKDLQDKLLNTSTKTITGSDGQNYDVPDGILNRKRTQAQGVTEEYDKFASGLKNRYIAQIKNPRVQAEFDKTISSRIIALRDNVLAHEAKEGIDASKDNLSAFVTSEMASYPYLNESDRAKTINGINSRINAQYKRGVLDLSESESLKKSVKWDVFLNDFRSDARATEKAFNEGKYGFDIDMAEKARTKIKELNVMRKEEYEATRYTLNTRVLQNNIEEEEIDRLVALNKNDPDQGIPENTGKMLKTALYAQIEKDVKAIPKAKKYIKAANMVFSNTADRVKAYDAILESYDGNTTRDELLYLTELVKASKMSKNQNTTNAIVNAWRGLRSAVGFKKPDVEKEVEIVKAFINKIRLGENPQTAVQSTLYDQQVAEHPALLANPDSVSAIYAPGKGTKYLNAKKPKEEKVK